MTFGEFCFVIVFLAACFLVGEWHGRREQKRDDEKPTEDGPVD